MTIKEYEGKVEELGPAEQFFHKLIQLPDYQLRMDLLLFAKEFPSQAETHKTQMMEVDNSCKEVLESASFRKFLHFGLHVGNVLNAVKPISRIFYSNSSKKKFILKKNFRDDLRAKPEQSNSMAYQSLRKLAVIIRNYHCCISWFRKPRNRTTKRCTSSTISSFWKKQAGNQKS